MLFARAKDSQTWLVVGLGNPGTKYQNTRHNIGQLALDALAGDNKYEKHKSGMLVCTKKLGEVKLLLAKSTGFMNETGVPTKSLASFYKISSNNLVAIHDELDLPFNSLRIKVGGSDNGHNGLKSLTTHFGADYYRIRLGIGRPSNQMDPADYVLQKFSQSESKQILDFSITAAQAIETLILKGLSKAQTQFND